MKINYKDTHEQFHLLSGLSIEDTKIFFKTFLLKLVLDFVDNESSIIPGLGEVKISYKGEKYQKEGKQAVVDIHITPDDVLLRNIGQAKDGDELDIEREIKSKIQSSLDIILGK